MQILHFHPNYTEKYLFEQLSIYFKWNAQVLEVATRVSWCVCVCSFMPSTFRKKLFYLFIYLFIIIVIIL